MRIDSISDNLQTNNNSIEAKSKNSFENILSDAMEITNQAEDNDKKNSIGLLTGEINDLHTAMIDMEKADIALQLTVQIRNKILDAYNEIMRMQL